MIGRLLRSVAVLSALATAMMPGVLAVAEGAIEAATVASAHVEPAGGSESCPVAHDAHCAACNLLRHGYAGPEAAPATSPLARFADGVPFTRPVAAQGRLYSSGNPRAPPAA